MAASGKAFWKSRTFIGLALMVAGFLCNTVADFNEWAVHGTVAFVAGTVLAFWGRIKAGGLVP